MDAVVFDLDDTLVDTSPLRAARKGGRWKEVFDRLHEAVALPGDPHELPGRLRAIGLKVGVATSSPRPYAEALLDRFKIESDILITGSDKYAPKPDPGALLAAAGELGEDPDAVAYVGDQAVDFQAAAGAGMLSIGARWGTGTEYPHHWARHWPDLAIRTPTTLTDVESWDRRKLIAEVTLEGRVPIIHSGSVIAVQQQVFSLGRYFTRTDPRCVRHPLSQAIIANKSSYKNAAELTDALGILEKLTSYQGAVVVSVPSSGDEPFDRFAPYRVAAAEAIRGIARDDVLRQKTAVEAYKHLRGLEARRVVNVGRFKATGSLEGKAVLLLDDVLTTGSTLESCRDQLTGAGAERVVCVTFAVSQEPLPQLCPGCGVGILQYKERWSDGRPFWACSRWCGYIEDISTSV